LPRRQRLLGQIWGTVGAVALRLAFVTIVSVLLRIPLLRLVGGLLLVWIAYKLVQPVSASLEGGRHGTSFWQAIWIIIVADITMSLDNVLAIAAAAHGDMALVILGVAISLPIVVGGSGLLAALMNRFGWIIWIGGGILGYVAGDMILEDPVVMNMLGALARTLEYPLPLAVGIVIATLGWWLARRAGAGEPGMTWLMDPEFWARLLGIILIDISLAGDNALVIALAVRGLAPRQQLLGRIWGTAGAVGLRVAFIAIVSYLLSIPLLQLLGGLALIWIAIRLVKPGQTEHGDRGRAPRSARRSGSSSWPT
jgi:YjbE family integral membrane protein